MTLITKKKPSIMTTCIKRCNAEMLDLYENYKCFHSIKLHVNNEDVHFIIEKCGGNEYKFLLSSKYPFHEPKLLINNKLYVSNILQTPRSERIRNLFNKYNLKCMCCSSILYDKNWSPACRIQSVLNEIEQINIIKKYVKHYLILDDICIVKNTHTDTIGMIILDFLLDNPFNGTLFCKVN